MKTNVQISAVNLRDFARSQGWQLIPEAAKDRLYVLNHDLYKPRQLVFAMEESAPDYKESLTLAAEKLAEINGVQLPYLLSKIEEAPDDTVQFRVFGDSVDESSLPFTFTTTLLQSAQQLISAAAHTMVNPQPHHPRLSHYRYFVAFGCL